MDPSHHNTDRTKPGHAVGVCPRPLAEAGATMMNRPAYYELPISGSLTTKTGEVIEYRAESKRLEDGAYIIEGAWARDKDNIMFP